jgi:hypothetical protein
MGGSARVDEFGSGNDCDGFFVDFSEKNLGVCGNFDAIFS